MSKSLDNFFTVREDFRDLRRRSGSPFAHRESLPQSYQLFRAEFASVTSVLERFYNCLKGLDIDSAKSLTNSRFEKAFFAAMDDDFNTPEAFSVLFEIVKEINKQKEGDPVLANQLGALLVRLANLLGILQSYSSRISAQQRRYRRR